MDTRTVKLSQKEAAYLLQNFGEVLSRLAIIAQTGYDNGKYVGYRSHWSGDITPGIISALKSIAANEKTMQPVKIFNSTMSRNPQICLSNLVFGRYKDDFDDIIKTYGASDIEFAMKLQEFQNFMLQNSNKLQSTHAHLKTNTPPSPSSLKPKKASSSSSEENSSSEEEKVKGVSYTKVPDNMDFQINHKYSAHYRVPGNNKNLAQKIVADMKQQGMPISIHNDIITIGPSQGMGTPGAYLSYAFFGSNDEAYFLGLEFKNEQQRNTFAQLVGISVPNSGNLNKFLIDDINSLKKTDKPEPKPITNTKAKSVPATQHATNTQPIHSMDDQIKIFFSTLDDYSPGKWAKIENTKWEVGRSNHSGNLALASAHIQIEYDKHQQITVLDKNNKYQKATDGERYYALRSVLQLRNQTKRLAPQAQELIDKITTQIEKYYQEIKENIKNTDKKEDIKTWKDKIGVLGEAMSVLDGNSIDLDTAAKKYPLCRAGDGRVMTSETTKLLMAVKKSVAEERSHSPRPR